MGQLKFFQIVFALTLIISSCTQTETPTNVLDFDSTANPTISKTKTSTRNSISLTDASHEDLLTETKNAKTPLSTPTPEIPLATIMEDFPLEVGTTWVYRVTIEYSVGDWTFTEDGEAIEPPWETWSGLVAQQIIEQTQDLPDGDPTFLVKLYDVPKLMQDGIVTSDKETQLIVKNNSIYDESIRLIRWPLEVGATWDPWDDTAEPQGTGSYYNWSILDTESVETGLGIIDGCYLIQLTTQPDTTSNWMCPGIGLARIYGWSGGMPMEIFEWVLESFSLPSN
jgi:hypothetical protein